MNLTALAYLLPRCLHDRGPLMNHPTYPTYPTVQNPQPRYWQQPHPYQQYVHPQPAGAGRTATECERCQE